MPNEAAAEMFNETEHREQRAVAAAKPPASINPFDSMAQASNAAAVTDQSRAVAEVQAAMLIARQFPRNEIVAMDKILNAFTRESLAEVAQYEYGKGGTDVRGPSIRAAEAIAQRWGNIHCGVEEIEQRPGASTVRAFAFDAESGFQDAKVFQVEHIRYTRKGSYKIEDPREIYELIANQGARRKRACLLAVIPGDVVEAAMKQADVTLHTKAEVTPEILQKLLESFTPFGVTKEAIEKRIQRRLDAMTPAQLVNLRKVYNSLRDGMSGPADWFEDAPAAATPTEQSRSGAAGLKAAAAAKTADPTAATAEGTTSAAPAAETTTATGETKPAAAVTQKAKGEPITLAYATVRDRLDEAFGKKSRDKLDEAAAEISLVVGLPDQKKLTELYKAHVAALEANK